MVNKFKVTSRAFDNNNTFIPIKYTAQGEEISPPLSFKGIIENAKSIALIMEDDILPFFKITHWLLWNIPTDIYEIPENLTIDNLKILSDKVCISKNFFGKKSYLGPNPFSGTHKYIIRVYVLNDFINLKQGSGKKILLKSIKKHILQHSELIGYYSKKKK